MFDLGMSELLVVGAVGLIVIGPKDLPEVFRQLGRFTAKARAMGREFSRAMEQAASEAGVKDVADDLKKIGNPRSLGVDAMKDAVDKFEKWDPLNNAAKPSKPLSSSEITGEDDDADFPASDFDETTPADGAETEAEHGPATKALYEKQAARKAVIEETSAKLKALDEGESAPPNPRKPRASTSKTGRSKTDGRKSAAKGSGSAPGKGASGDAAPKPSRAGKPSAGTVRSGGSKPATAKPGTSKAAADKTSADKTPAKADAAATAKTGRSRKKTSSKTAAS